MLGVRAAVVGAGNIGSKLDDPRSAIVRTHANGYLRSACNLVGLCDLNRTTVREAQKWKTKY